MERLGDWNGRERKHNTFGVSCVRLRALSFTHYPLMQHEYLVGVRVGGQDTEMRQDTEIREVKKRSDFLSPINEVKPLQIPLQFSPECLISFPPFKLSTPYAQMRYYNFLNFSALIWKSGITFPPYVKFLTDCLQSKWVFNKWLFPFPLLLIESSQTGRCLISGFPFVNWWIRGKVEGRLGGHHKARR